MKFKSLKKHVKNIVAVKKYYKNFLDAIRLLEIKTPTEKYSQKLNDNAHYAVQVLRRNPLVPKIPNKQRTDKRNFTILAYTRNKKKLFISMSYITNAIEKNFIYIVDLKHYKIYQIDKDKVIFLDYI
ncbi:MAG: hypothetical protein LBG80_19155 [Bacteroidales bacterium]|jgi:hypothetical protein|nr:hypothetical protein [Bacteroidales bacterium]